MPKDYTTEQYLIDSSRTAAGNFYPEKVGYVTAYRVLEDFIALGSKIDDFKKALFYGKNFSQPDFCISLQESGCVEINTNIVHGIIGKITEAVELAELLNVMMYTGELDTPNLLEEVGDGLWYDAMILRELGCSFEDVMQANIEKLKLRYPDKFTEHEALNRNLELERKNLEKSVDNLNSKV